jgi:NAD+ diphosphatase
MMHCPDCGQVEYPKISPAVIVGVTDGDRLLLTKYAGRSFTRYALIAGFTEIGETIEETVQREVMEEVGLKVKNIRYYRSQPWSFSDTLLMGFFADLDGEDRIRLDEEELSVAEWHTRGTIPGDDGISLTREMMRVFNEGGI